MIIVSSCDYLQLAGMLAEHREFLRFGDSIYLHACAEVDLVRRREEVDDYPRNYYANIPGADSSVGLLNGFLSAKGFMSEDVFFQKTNVPLSLNEVEMPNLLNSRDFRFIIVPELKCDFHQEYERAMEELKKVQQLVQKIDGSELPNYLDSVKKFEDRVQSAKERAKKEVLHNRQLIKESFGKEIYYGLEIQLMHQDSETFLNVKDECSETEKIGYKLELCRHFQPRMIFQLIPRFKSRLLGEKIQYGDLVHLQHVISKQKLCISDTQFEMPFDLSKEDDNPLLTQQNVVDPNCSRHIAYIGDSEYNIWKILVHSKWDTATRLATKIRGHDIVRFHVADADAYLTSSVSFEGAQAEVYLRHYYGDSPGEKTGINSLWELTHFCKIFQGAEFLTHATDRVLLRHFNSGKILAVSKNNLPYLQDYGEYLRREAEQQGSTAPSHHQLINLHGAADQSGFEMDGQFLQNARSNARLPVSVGASPEPSSESEHSDDAAANPRKKTMSSVVVPGTQFPKQNFPGSEDNDSFEEKVFEEKNEEPARNPLPKTGYKVSLNIKQKGLNQMASRSNPSLTPTDERTGIATHLRSVTAQKGDPNNTGTDDLVAGVAKTDKPNKEKLDMIFKRPQDKRGSARNPGTLGEQNTFGTHLGQQGESLQTPSLQSPPIIRRKQLDASHQMKNQLEVDDSQKGQLTGKPTTQQPPADLDVLLAFQDEAPDVVRNLSPKGDADVKTLQHRRNTGGVREGMSNQLLQDQGSPGSNLLGSSQQQELKSGESPNKLRNNLSRFLRREDSHYFNESGSSPQKRGTHFAKKTNIMNLKTLLPHQIALKDSPHTVVFSHFQKTTVRYISDGNTVNLHKSTSSKYSLKFLSLCYRMQNVYDRVNTKHPEPEHESGRRGIDDSNIFQRQERKALFNPIEEKHLQSELTAVAFMSGPITSALTIHRVKDSEVRCYLKLKSILEPMKMLSLAFKHNKSDMVTNIRLLKTQNILRLLICYLYDVEHGQVPDFSEIDTEPVPERQIAFKEIGMIDTLMELIHFPFEKNFYQIEHVHKPLYISRVLSLSYTAIRAGIREIRSNELYASQWLDMMIGYAIKDSKNILKAKDTLTELIDNNERILRHHLKEETIRNFASNLLNSKPDSKNVSILRALCICNGKAIQKNQEIITVCILEDKTQMRILTKEIKINDVGTIVMANPWSPDEKMVELKLLKQKSESRDKGGELYFDFYTNLIGLFSDVCHGRNYRAINILKEAFSLEVVMEVIVNPVHPPELRKEFVCLFGRLYLDVFPFQHLTIPYMVRDLKNIKTEVLTVPQSQPDNKQDFSGGGRNQSDEETQKINRTRFGRLLDFLLEFLNKGSISFDDADPKMISFIEQVLELLTQLIRFGFFPSAGELHSIYVGLMRITSPLWKGDMISPSQVQKEDVSTQRDGQGRKAPTRRATSILDVSMIRSSADTETFTDLRKSICEMVRVLLEVELDFQVSKTLEVYKSEHAHLFDSLNIMSDSLAVDSLILTDSFTQKSLLSKNIRKLFENTHEKVIQVGSVIITNKKQLVAMLIDNTLVDDNQLKKMSLALLKDLYSSAERVITTMKKVLIVENEAEVKLKHNAEKIQLTLFKLHEQIPNWYGKPESHEVHQLKSCLYSLTKELEEYHVLKSNGGSLRFGDEVPSLGPELQNLAGKYLFMKASIWNSFQSANVFYSELIESTGILKELAKILDFMISNPSLVPKHLIESSRSLVNSLALELGKLVLMGTSAKSSLGPRIAEWIETSTLYGENGEIAIQDTIKHMFSTKTFSEDLHQNFQLLQAGVSPIARSGQVSQLKFISSPSKVQFERTKSKFLHDLDMTPAVEGSAFIKNRDSVSPSRFKALSKELPENIFAEEGENPHFGGLALIVCNYLKENKAVASSKHEVEVLGSHILGYLSSEDLKHLNYFMSSFYLYALEQFVYLKGHAIKSTQNFILRQLVERSKQGVFCRFQSIILEDTLLEDLSCPEVVSKLNTDLVYIQNPKLCLSVAFLGLLSACSFERNEYGEKIAQSIVPAEVILKILRLNPYTSSSPEVAEESRDRATPNSKGFSKQLKQIHLVRAGVNRPGGSPQNPKRNLLLEYELVKFMVYSYFETEINYDSKQMETNIQLMEVDIVFDSRPCMTICSAPSSRTWQRACM